MDVSPEADVICVAHESTSDPFFHHFLGRSVCTPSGSHARWQAVLRRAEWVSEPRSVVGAPESSTPECSCATTSAVRAQAPGCARARRSPLACPDPATSARSGVRRAARCARTRHPDRARRGRHRGRRRDRRRPVARHRGRTSPTRCRRCPRRDSTGHPDAPTSSTATRSCPAPPTGRRRPHRPTRQPRPRQGGRARARLRPRRRRPGEPLVPGPAGDRRRRCCRRTASTARRCPAWSRCGWARAAGA